MWQNIIIYSRLWQNVLDTNQKSSLKCYLFIYLFIYIIKYSEQICMLYINKLFKNIKNAKEKVPKNASRKKLYKVVFDFLEMSHTTDVLQLYMALPL